MRLRPTVYILMLATTMVSVTAKDAKKPVFVDPAFRFEDIDRLYILPTVDLRVTSDKHPKTPEQAEKDLQTVDFACRYFLQRHGYQPLPEDKKRPNLKGYRTAKQRAEHAPTRMSVTEDDLKQPQEAWVRKLGPNDARWVFLPALEDSESHLTFGASGSAIVMGTIFDRQNGKLVWRGVGVGRAGHAGLAFMALKSVMSEESLKEAASDLCSLVGMRGGKKK